MYIASDFSALFAAPPLTCPPVLWDAHADQPDYAHLPRDCYGLRCDHDMDICSPIFRSALSNPLSKISQQIRQDLFEIAEQISSDIEMGLHLHHYVREESGNNLQSALAELERCGCGGLSFYSSKIQSLCWYREISSNNILALQKALNKIPGCDTLTEDGVYGEKTSSAYNFLINELLHGSFPILTYIDPLQ